MGPRRSVEGSGRAAASPRGPTRGVGSGQDLCSVTFLLVVLLLPAASLALSTEESFRLRCLSCWRVALFSCSVTVLVLPPFTVTVLLATVFAPFLSFSVTLQVASVAGHPTVKLTVPVLDALGDLAMRVAFGAVLSTFEDWLLPPPPPPPPPDCVLAT